MRPVETLGDKQDRAKSLAGAGNHADAARGYAELATEDPAEHDNYELLSAEQWVAAGNVAQAKQALAAVSPDARTTQPASRALVAAEIALAENDGARAIHELDAIGPPAAWPRIIGISAAKRHSSPAIRSKARAPSSSANAT